MRRARWSATTAAGLVAMLALAGCAGAEESEEAEPPTPTESPVPTEPPAATAAPEPDEPTAVSDTLLARFHSEEQALQAEQNFESVFAHHDLPDDIEEFPLQADEPIWLPKLLVDCGMVSSTSDGRRMIKQNAVSIDGEKITDTDYTVEPTGRPILKVGKRRFCKVVFN